MKPRIYIDHTTSRLDVIEDILVVMVAKGDIEVDGPIGARINAKAVELNAAPLYTRPHKDWP